MLKRNRSNFLVGLLIGSLLVLLFWYYQKSTSAEDGALALLDRLADAQKRMRTQNGHHHITLPAAETAVESAGAVVAEEAPPPAALTADLQQIQGVGPVFARRLHQSGVHTVVTVAGLSSGRLAEILDISESRAENILGEAANLLQSL